MARSYLGQGPNGGLLFDLGDGGEPFEAPATGDLALYAGQLSGAAGGDPMAPFAPRPARTSVLRPEFAPPPVEPDPGMVEALRASRATERGRWTAGDPMAGAENEPVAAPSKPPPPEPPPATPPPPETAKGKVITGADVGVSVGDSESDRDRATAAALARERGLRALQGSPGVYDPGGERLRGYSVQRQQVPSLAPLREEEAARRAGLSPEALAQLRARVERGRALIESKEFQAIGEDMQAPVLAKQRADEKALSPFVEKEPGVLAATRDLERKEGLATDEAARLSGVDQAEMARRASAAAEREALAQAQVTRRQEFEDRKKKDLGDIYGKIDAKRAEYETASVDDKRWWKNRSTGEVVGAGIAMALGDFVGGLVGRPRAAGQPNPILVSIEREVEKDIQAQVRDIDKKGKELGQLAEVYQFAKDKFGSEDAGMIAAHLAALDVVAAKVDRFALEANTERAKINAGKLKADLEAQQALRRLQLEQAGAGQWSGQVEVVQAGMRGGKAPNLKEAQEAFGDAAKLSDQSTKQQVMFGGQTFALGAFAESGEGKEMRKNMNLVNNALAEVQSLKEKRASGLRNNSAYTSSAAYINAVNRTAANVSKLLEMGVLQGNEREEAQKLYSNMLSGGDVLDDTLVFLRRIGRGQLDQLGAKPINTRGASAWPVQIGSGGPGGPAAGKKSTVSVKVGSGGGKTPAVKSALPEGKK